MHVAAWFILAAVALGCIAVDLLISRRHPTQSTRSALYASGIWTALGLAFAPIVGWLAGSGEAGHYLSVFALEKTLSLDNVAMFAAVLGAARLSRVTTDRVLTGGLLGALVLRVAFIAAGLAVVDAIHIVMLGFAVVLVLSGIRMARSSAHARPSAESAAPEAPPGSRWAPPALRRHPAMLALVAISVVDLAFAADSILAAFAVTTSAFAIVAANIFAVLGLRPLYVLLSGAMERFRYLKVGIGGLLVAIGIELGVEHFVPVPSWVTLAAVGVALAGSIGASLAADNGLSPRRLIRKVGVTVGGFAMLLAGAAMLVLPGPGLLVIVGGLALLATEYAWAGRPLAKLRARLNQLGDVARRTRRTRFRRSAGATRGETPCDNPR